MKSDNRRYRTLRYTGPDGERWTGILTEIHSLSGVSYGFWLEADRAEVSGEQFTTTCRHIEESPWLVCASEGGMFLHLAAPQILDQAQGQGEDSYGDIPWRITGYGRNLLEHRQAITPCEMQFDTAVFECKAIQLLFPHKIKIDRVARNISYSEAEHITVPLEDFGVIKIVRDINPDRRRDGQIICQESSRIVLKLDQKIELAELSDNYIKLHSFFNFLYGKRMRAEPIRMLLNPDLRDRDQPILTTGGFIHNETGQEDRYGAALPIGPNFSITELGTALQTYWPKRKILHRLITSSLMALHEQANGTWALFGALATLDIYTSSITISSKTRSKCGEKNPEKYFTTRMERLITRLIESGWPLPDATLAKEYLRDIRNNLMHEGRSPANTFEAKSLAAAMLYGAIALELNIPYSAIKLSSSNLAALGQIDPKLGR